MLFRDSDLKKMGEETNIDLNGERRKSLTPTHLLANPKKGDEVVITGMAGRLPDSDDVYHFRDNLYNKVDMVSSDNRRWKPIISGLPHRSGKLNFLDKFDANFFGINERHGHVMDPSARMLLEKSFEAILDAGFNPTELKGSKTGIFVGNCNSDSERSIMYEDSHPKSHAAFGCSKSISAQRLSYFYQFNGPVLNIDTACSSSLFALEHAFKSIRTGECDSAIVAGLNLCLDPYASLQFAKLGVLSPDGSCKCFDNAANGYARSEGVCVVLVQKAKDARRIYAEVVYAKTNSDGFKEQNITYPSGEDQKVLLDEFYQDCEMDPNTIHYLEAHGTGTKVGDPEELKTIDEVFCQSRKAPLLMGAVKSNIGHNEPVAGISSIIKVLLSMESGYIAPNLHYKTPREGIKGLVNGAIQVVTEKTKWPECEEILAAINSFGFGGANCHVLLKRNTATKAAIKEGNPMQLVCVSGRTVEAVECLLESVEKEGKDVEYIRLLHQIFGMEIQNHCYRGFAILDQKGLTETSVAHYNGHKGPLYIGCGTFDKSWPKIGKDLLHFQLFKEFINRCQSISKRTKLDILDIILNYDMTNIVHQYVFTVVFQMGVFEILKQCRLEPDVILAHSLGELSAAYFEGILNLEQVISVAYYAARSIEANSDAVQLSSIISNIVPGELNLGRKWIPNGLINGNKNLNGRYFARALLNQGPPTNFPDRIPKEAVLLKLGNLDGSDCETIIEFVPSGNPTLAGMYEGLGRLYQFGYNLKLDGLYPEVTYPVRRGTSSISPYIKWHYDTDWTVRVPQYDRKMKGFVRNILITLQEEDWSCISGHVIDGKILFPATGYLLLILKGLATMLDKYFVDMKVLFTNIRFLRATTISDKSPLKLDVFIQKHSGLFEIVESGSVVVTGQIQELDESENNLTSLAIPTCNDDAQILSQNDIYKELQLRGYNYRGPFKALQEVNLTANHGLIKWTGDWVTFMDNMMQMTILKHDTRLLYVPISIDQLTINAKAHMKYVTQLGENPSVPVHLCEDLKLISCGFIELRGLTARSIPRRKQVEPVLETYKFVPNVTTLILEQSICANAHLALENRSTIKPSIVEILGAEEEPLIPLMQSVFNKLPIIQAELILLTNRTFEFEGITVEDKKLSKEHEYFMIIGTKLLEDPQQQERLLDCIKSNGFIMSREDLNGNLCRMDKDLKIICDHSTDTERIVLLQKNEESSKCTAINVETADDEFAWFNTLQEALKSKTNVILYSQGSSHSGLLGLVNCLRREPNGEQVRAVLIFDENMPPFDQQLPVYKQQLDKGLAMNVFKGGCWGTYRHLPLPRNNLIKMDHCYVNPLVRGDLSSLSWVEGPLKPDMKVEPGKAFIRISYAAINFRDVMTASGRISVDTITRNRWEQDCVQGIEFAGTDNYGKRWMGMSESGMMATLAYADAALLIPVPDEWSLEEAATVPVVYATVLYGFFVRAKLRAGQSVLVHSGTGGVGQAAINVALHSGCTVFTTVGTDEKRAFIREHFPQIPPDHIGCSRDTSFEQMVLQRTKGRGVDLVLNSLAEEKLQASVRCLARGGSFVEIGKFDLASNNPLCMELFKREITFSGCMLDAVFNMDYTEKIKISALIGDGLRRGIIKPLPRTCFSKEKVEDAFRYMASGKHIGKVLIRVREDNLSEMKLAKLEKFDGLPRFYCDPCKSYVIIGGLGGFGLELADFLALRGAKNLLLTTRNGVRTGYQATRIKIWLSYGVKVAVLKNESNTYENCKSIVAEAQKLGPVGGIFNLAVVLKDALFENQTIDNYRVSFAAKVDSTKHLDRVTRQLCPELEYFVVFSSVSCGRGNAGQTNYGMANSVMERVCEERVRDGLPGLAIQWGAVGDVGLVAELQLEHIDLVIGGTLQQRITSCLEVLDRFLRQTEPVVASMVVATKRSRAGTASNIVEAVVQIMGFRDLKTVSLHSTLPELGLDSMMAVEIKQTLEREFDIFLTPQDIRTMTFAKLKEIAAADKSTDQKTKADESTANLPIFFNSIAPEELSKSSCVHMKKLSNANTQTVMILPGLDGNSLMYDNFSKQINANVVCFQYCANVEENTVEEIAAKIYLEALSLVREKGAFNLIAHSFGSLIALELAGMLEKDGYRGNLVIIDGGVELMKKLLKSHIQTDNEIALQFALIEGLMSAFKLTEIFKTIQLDLMKCANFSERIHFAYGKSKVDVPHSLEYIENMCISIYNLLRAVINYENEKDETKIKIQSNVWLYRPTIQSMTDVSEDYKLSERCEKVIVSFFEGNHLSILDNEAIVPDINKMLGLPKIERETEKLNQVVDNECIASLIETNS